MVDKRLILIVYEGDIDLAEMQRINRELDKYLSEGESPIHIISDHRKMGEAKLDLNLVREIFTSMKKRGWGWVILVAVPPLVRFFANVFGIQFGLHVKTAPSIEAAKAMIEREDTSLQTRHNRR
jgi:hypothetical protein